jgi:hypothetical protein
MLIRNRQRGDQSKGAKMAEPVEVNIGQVKEMVELVNRVAEGHERIVLTSRGQAKAALVSMEDYALC